MNGLPLEVPPAGTAIIIPGAPDALSAIVLARIGYQAIYISGAGLANSSLGVPDLGLVTLTEVADQVERIRGAVDLPIVVDADTGFGGPLNVRRTIRTLELRGASAAQLEDQSFPKRCGHFDGKEIVSSADMTARLTAAVEARRDDQFKIIARTDARAVTGIDDALRRALEYKEAGADILFVEAPHDLDEIKTIARELPGPLLLNLVEGGKTPPVPAAELGRLGYSYVLYANSAMRAAMYGLQRVMSDLLEVGSTEGVLGSLIDWEERQDLVGKAAFDELERRYRVEVPE
jgi:2-methylisocitrate lyase-like PEP mutase family enzyme